MLSWVNSTQRPTPTLPPALLPSWLSMASLALCVTLGHPFLAHPRTTGPLWCARCRSCRWPQCRMAPLPHHARHTQGGGPSTRVLCLGSRPGLCDHIPGEIQHHCQYPSIRKQRPPRARLACAERLQAGRAGALGLLDALGPGAVLAPAGVQSALSPLRPLQTQYAIQVVAQAVLTDKMNS